MKRWSKADSSGFTIIEIMIVLVIAAVILLIVFLAVPALQRNYRNYRRKNAVAFIVADMGNYYAQHGQFPLDVPTGYDDTAAYIDSLKDTPAKGFKIRYVDSTKSHEYPFNTGNPDAAFDEISIEASHWCALPGKKAYDADYPIRSAGVVDTNYREFVVWTQLEQAPTFCLDSEN